MNVPKKLYKILEIIGILVIILIGYYIFPFVRNIIGLIMKIILPFIIGFAIAFIFEPIIEKLEAKKMNRKVAIALIVFIIIGILIAFFRLFLPLMVKQLNSIIDQIPNYFEQIKGLMDKINQKINSITGTYTLDYDKIEGIIVDYFSKLVTRIGSILQRSFSYIISVFITPILMIYFMADYPNIENYFKKKLLEKNKIATYECLSKIKQSLQQYVKGVLIVMTILIIISSIVFSLIGIEYAIVFGIIVGITDIIPYIGPYIGGGIVVIFTLATNPSKTLFVIISIVIMQFLEGNLLVPKIQSKTMKTKPLIVLLSVAFFGEILGIFGILIAVPMSRIIEIIIQSWYSYKKM